MTPIRTVLLIAVALLLTCVSAPATERVTEPFVGVTITQVEQVEPRPLRICVAEIDLDAEGVSFLVSPGNGDPNGAAPGDPNNETTRETTLDFLRRHNAQLAINATFFSMRSTDTGNQGLVISRGERVSPFRYHWPAMAISRNNEARIVRGEHDTFTFRDGFAEADAYNAVSGSDQIVTDGRVTVRERDFSTDSHPRTAIGHTADRRLVLMTVDGRQPGVSEGVSLAELAALMRQRGCVNAINLDGGGSTTMAIADPQPRVLNTPSGKNLWRRPGVLRANGTSLGVFAKPVE